MIDARKVTEILADKYHNNLTVKEIRTKHKISQSVWTEINKNFGDMFIKKYGKKKMNRISVTAKELDELWKD